MAYGNFCIGANGSLQAPFFPGECDIKGVSSLIYGLIFGVFELVIIVTCPIFSKMFAYVTPYFFLEFGLFLIGATAVLFGVLDKVTRSLEFSVFAFSLRMGEGVGTAAFIASSHAIRSSEFSRHAAYAHMVLSTASSLGSLLGSPVGGALFTAGGYVMPFVVFGGLLLFGSLVSIVILPKSDDYTLNSNPVSLRNQSDQLVDVLVIAGCVALTGFNDVTLAHHLSQFDLSPIEIGSIFIANRLAYSLVFFGWRKLGRLEFDALWISILGTVINIIGLSLIGPVSFIPIEPKLWLIIVSLIIIGIGLAAKQVGSFFSNRSASRGYLNANLTHDEVSAINTLTSIAAFVGPVTGGYLIGTIGYRSATEVALALEIFTVIQFIQQTNLIKLIIFSSIFSAYTFNRSQNLWILIFGQTIFIFLKYFKI
uniref:Major facilitator superfamily (MFS) profile domain-containing protein n=1 Tax=Tetranychus urticae TaxID=32264 RepID=T1KJ10_TETUR